MTPTAIIMMVISLVTIWGGLVVAILLLRRQPEHPESDGD
ncbi:putative methionine/alanine importer small subunit [Stackebrandtia endophytica]|uniref:Putative methionine/alanine importer small subunit n=1 Tax=Stackebrandtia endophytica TaxID=1496996 RepID=A0A543AXL4_9ACTN|nr:methionine/alanine import family NSS transporter small subunit [Stackebrandtia endophytica]TQL77293.1 putative methionine/alanine importer small subunit [Stackebrandtia endophytica]